MTLAYERVARAEMNLSSLGVQIPARDLTTAIFRAQQALNDLYSRLVFE
jgi:hypothetical protein